MARDDAQLTADIRVASSRVDLARDTPSPFDDPELDSSSAEYQLEEEPKFLRTQKRVPVRRGPLPRKTVGQVRVAFVVCCMLALIGTGYGLSYRYGTHNWRFRLGSRDDISIQGLLNVSHSQVLEVFGGDLGRNIFFISLAERKRQLEEIPWVESAAVMRLLPGRIAVEIHERTPIAFTEIGSRVALIDSYGVLMDTPRNANYSFPVISGLGEAEPRSGRAGRMKVFSRLVRELDSEGAHYSKDLSEVDLSDPDDVKATVSDPSGAVLIHLGSEQFLERYKVYRAHLEEWRQQFQKLESVDLRYDKQIIVNPDAVPRAGSRRK